MKVALDYNIVLDIVNRASLAMGYLTAQDQTDTAKEIGTGLQQSITRLLDAAYKGMKT